MDTPIESLGTRLKSLVDDSGESARSVSELAGLSPTHAGLIMSGARLDPSGKTIESLATVLGADPTWLLTGRGHAPSARKIRAAVQTARVAVQSKRTGTES